MDEHEDSAARERDTGMGYPEEAPAGSGIDPREHPENEVTPDHDEPHTNSEEDGDPAQATGNPKAAGGGDSP